MNISYKWLKEYVDFDLTPEQVCEALTSTGLEVGALEEVQRSDGKKDRCLPENAAVHRIKGFPGRRGHGWYDHSQWGGKDHRRR